MGEANMILRSSIHAFLQGYHIFISVTALFLVPVSASILLSQAYIASSPISFRLISLRLTSLFHAAAFPSSSQLFTLMLSQTIFSTIFTLPFTLTFLLLAKASIIQIVRRKSPSSLLNLYFHLLLTHLFNSFLILSANASIFALLFIAFTLAEVAALPSSTSLLIIPLSGAILYSIVLANVLVICNLAIIVSATEKRSGYVPVIKACMLIKGRVATALSIALPTNLALAAIEALFQYRVIRTYHMSAKFSSSIITESLVISYMHSVVIVVEIIASCLFYKSCKLRCGEKWEDEGVGYSVEFEPEEKSQV